MDGGSAVREGVHAAGAGTRGRMRRPLVTAGVAAVGFAATTALVATDATQGLDERTQHLFRPHDEWGPTQLRFDHIVEGLSPEHLMVLLAVGTVVAVVARRSWVPVFLVVPPIAVASCVTWLVKVGVDRPDPNGGIADTGGSYPSGHMIFLVVCGGLLAMLLVRRPPWWVWWALGAAAALMALSLLATTAHWLSDVVGGTFLGVAVVATVAWRESGSSDGP
jgi:membrane-associated phospholipid phosphatase